MSISSIEEDEEKELIIFDNLEILYFEDSGSILKEAVCEININKNHKKKIIIKMNNTINNSQSSQSEKLVNDEDNEVNNGSEESSINIDNEKKAKSQKLKEISKVKYNLFLGITKDCQPSYDKFDDVMDGSDLIGQRLIIQDIELSNNGINFQPKKYIFIGYKIAPIFPLENNKQIILSNDANKKVMILNDKKLVSSEDFKLNDIINEKIKKINDTNSQNNETFSSISENNNSLNHNKSVNKNTSKNKEKLSKNKSNISSVYGVSSQFNNSSETEPDQGYVFYDEIEKGKKFTKYSYTKIYKKEIDGIFEIHEEIKLNKGIIELKFDKDKNFDNLNEEYDTNNDLNAHILIKNFTETSIPKDAPFILEVKSSFQLVEVLKQIRKASKFIENFINNKRQLPRYIIGILCSYIKKDVERDFKTLNSNYYGYNDHDTLNGVSLYEHIKKIINNNKIKFVIAVIKDGYIKKCDLLHDDFKIPEFHRVNVDLMYKELKGIELLDTLGEEEREKKQNEIKAKVNKIKDKFKALDKSINTVSENSGLQFKVMKMENDIKEKDDKINQLEKKMADLMREIEILKKQNNFSKEGKDNEKDKRKTP